MSHSCLVLELLKPYQIWIFWDNFCQLCTTQISGFLSFCGQGYALTRHAYIQSVAFWCRIKVKIQYQHPYNKTMMNNPISFETGWQQNSQRVPKISLTFAHQTGRVDTYPLFHKLQWVSDNFWVHIGLLNKESNKLAFRSSCKPDWTYHSTFWCG